MQDAITLRQPEGRVDRLMSLLTVVEPSRLFMAECTRIRRRCAFEGDPTVGRGGILYGW